MANLGPDFLVNSNFNDNQINPSVTALSDGRFVVVWESADQNIDGDGSCILMQIYNPDGSLSGNETLVNTIVADSQSRPVVAALQGGGFVIAWESENGDGLGSGISARIYDVAGNPAGPFNDEFLVNSDPVGNQTSPAIAALDDGGFVIAWTTPDVDDTGIKARLFSANGTPVDNAVNGNSNDFIVNNLTTADPQTEVSVTATNDGFLVTWYSEEDDGGPGGPGAVRGRAFDFGGEPVDFGGAILDNDYIINSTTENAQFEPSATRLADGRILVTWTSYDNTGDGDPTSIRGRILEPDGSLADDDFVINSTGVGNQSAPTVAALPNGGFVVVWTSLDGGDGSNSCIRARIYDSSGDPIGNDFVANFEGTNAQFAPSVSTLPDGRIVITWTTEEIGITSEIRAVIFNADGNGVTVAATDNGDTLIGSDGNDTLNGGKGSDTLNGLDGNDSLLGGGRDDVLNGGNGDDLLNGGADGDIIDGGDQTEDGADTVLYFNNAVGIYLNLGLTNTDFNASGGDASFDKISNVENIVGSEFNDTLIGDDNDNEIHALAGADTIDGGAGDDKIMGGAGADIIDGGAGLDGVSYEFSAAGVTLTLGANGAQATASGGAGSDAIGDKISNAEIVLGSNFIDSLTGNNLDNKFFGSFGNDILKGGDGNDELDGGDGADNLDGGNGDDILRPGDGIDTVTGGAGNDTVSYDVGITDNGGITITLGANGLQTTATGAFAQGDKISLVENVVGTDDDDNADTITGNALDNIINGMSGKDVLTGGGNTAVGDTLSYEFSNPAVTLTLNLNGSYVGGHAEGDNATGFENVIGGRAADEITGDAGDNVIEGRQGGDTLDGGANTIIGDTLSYAGSDGAVTIVINASASGGHADGDTNSNFENVLGSAFDDVLLGDDFNNKLSGGAGNDHLIGGEGDDILDGGAGARDRVDFNGGSTAITLTLSASGAAATTGITGVGPGKDTISNIEDIVGSDVVDKLTGNNFDNIIEGGKGGDILDGGAHSVGGGDTLSYSSDTAGVQVTLALAAFGAASTGGHALGDTNKNFENLRGGSGNDTLIGNSGNNVIEGGAGADIMHGGDGVDTLSYEHQVAGANIYLGEVGEITLAGGSAGADTGTGFENLIGSNSFDEFKSDHKTKATLIDGRGGGDDIVGTDVAALSDKLIGGDGDDVIEGRAGNDLIFGDAGDDELLGGDNNDTVEGGTGNDKIAGGAGNDILRGGDGNDTLIGGAGADNMDGGAGLDRLQFSGGTGTIIVNLAANTLTATGANDAVGDTIKNFEKIVAGTFGGSLNAIGTAGYNEISGGTGDDTVEGGGAGDKLDGEANGAGGDTLSYKNSALGVVVDLTQSKGFAGDADGDAFSNFENFRLSEKDDVFIDDIAQNGTIDGGAGTGDTISYRDQANGVAINLGVVLQGGGDKLIGFENIIGSDDLTGDSLTGNTGANVIEGGGGADVMDGGAGGDTLSYKSSESGVNVVLGLATFAVASTGGDAEGDTNKNFENLIGSEFTDANLAGNDLANKIEGLGGDDYIFGGLSADTLLGGDGNDNIMGHVGADIIDGGAGLDYISYTSGDETVGVVIALGKDGAKITASGGHAQGDQITNVEHIFGSAKNDTLTGNNLSNELFGDDGNDVIEGGGGADLLSGDLGIDTVRYLGSLVGVSVNLSLNDVADPLLSAAQSFGDADGDKLAGFENLTGSKKNDILIGDAGNNTIDGSDGDDTIIGGQGNDVLIGGAGTNDWLSYEGIFFVTINLGVTTQQNTVDSGLDTISGFENLRGSALDDKLTGSSGDNIIEGGFGADQMDGGAHGTGGDTLSYAGSGGVVVTLGLAAFGAASTGGDADGDTNKNFENLIGSGGDDILQGNSGANNIQGGSGNDTVTFGGTIGVTVDLSKQWTVSAAGVFTGGVVATGGEAADDKYAGFENIIGTTGKDKLTGDANINNLQGGDGDDTIEGGDGADFLDGGNNGAAGDTLSYAASTDGITLFLPGFASSGHAGGDTISGFENVIGTAFGDSIGGDAGANKLSGGDGNDGISGEAGDDVIDGGKGDDSLNGGADKDTLTGGDGNDNLSGDDGIDTIFGGIGDDIIRGGIGGDTLKGETGVDTLSYAGSAIGVTVTLNGATLDRDYRRDGWRCRRR